MWEGRDGRQEVCWKKKRMEGITLGQEGWQGTKPSIKSSGLVLKVLKTSMFSVLSYILFVYLYIQAENAEFDRTKDG